MCQIRTAEFKPLDCIVMGTKEDSNPENGVICYAGGVTNFGVLTTRSGNLEKCWGSARPS